MIQQSCSWVYNSKNWWELYFCVYCGINQSSQDREIIPVSINRWIDKENIIYACNGILSALKKKEILQHVTIWVNLDDIILSEIS